MLPTLGDFDLNVFDLGSYSGTQDGGPEFDISRTRLQLCEDARC